MSAQKFRYFVRSHHPAITDQEINFIPRTADDWPTLIAILERLSALEEDGVCLSDSSRQRML